MSKLVQIIQANKKFLTPEGENVIALDNVSLDVNAKEFITLLGPSGCGKTTLLRSISGFEKLDSGQILIDSKEMTNFQPYNRPVNTVFQNYALFPHINVENNVGYGLDVTNCEKKERNKRVKQTLELVGLLGFENRQPSQLSGGQQQRVALARAIINRPKILLLDEPLSALDRKLRQAMQLELKNIQNELGIAFIFVTHDQEEALTMSDKIIVMNNGKIIQEGTPTEIYDNPASEFTAQFIGESNFFTGKIIEIDDRLTIKTDCNNKIILKNFNQSNISKNTNITVLIRPEELLLSSDSNTEKYFIECEIKQIVFLGTDFKILCDIGNEKIIQCVVRDSQRKNISECKIGNKIKLFYNPSNLRILKNE
tara:strand:- start:1872 stop:2975 length:1104 start_codon:yes stop_codon:yes gene_type:complete